jgi:hypothetical protein
MTATVASIARSVFGTLIWSPALRKPNAISLAMMNYVMAVEATFGLTPEREAWDGMEDFLESQWTDEREEY